MSVAVLNRSCDRPPLRLAVKAPAKINLTLQVLGTRADGFHEIRSLAVGVGLHDELAAALSPGAGHQIQCSEPALSNDDNLVLRAARAWSDRFDPKAFFSFELAKRIPIGAGLGGGSSDAAAALRLAGAIRGDGIGTDQATVIAATLGSDVPFFFQLPAAVMTGRGESVTRVQLGWSGWALIVFFGESVSTADVYRVWRKDDSGIVDEALEASICRLRRADEIMGALRNDLETALARVHRDSDSWRRDLQSCGLGDFCVTGSGSACFRLYDDVSEARGAASRIQGFRPGVRTFVVPAPVGTAPLMGKDE